MNPSAVRCILLGTSAFAIPTAEVLARTSAPAPYRTSAAASSGTRRGETDRNTKHTDKRSAHVGSGAGCTLLGVITKPDESAGRYRALATPPLAAWAKEHDVQCWQPDTKVALTALLHELTPDVAVVAAYGKIISPEALTIPHLGFVNIHPSLLPKYRGPSPIHAAIANGDAETGVTLMLLDAEVDHGPIITQERIPLFPTATRSALERELAQRGAALLERVLPEYIAGRIAPQPQDHERATTTPLLSRAHGRIDWREPAEVIERKVRAYVGWPGAWCALPDGKRLKILRASLGDSTDAAPRAITPHGDAFTVACGDHRALVLDDVQPEGGSAMSGAEFLRGYRGPRALP